MKFISSTEKRNVYPWGTKRANNVVMKLRRVVPEMRNCEGFFLCQPKQAVEQTIDLTAIWDAMTFFWRHCKASFPTGMPANHSKFK